MKAPQRLLPFLLSLSTLAACSAAEDATVDEGATAGTDSAVPGEATTPEQATQMALRARDMLEPSSIEWRRAMDIVFASGATQEDVDDLDRRQEERNRYTVTPPSAG